MPIESKWHKQYLGDSVYAETDGYGIWLTTENGYFNDPSNRIYLEPSVLQSLNDYLNWLRKKSEPEEPDEPKE